MALCPPNSTLPTYSLCFLVQELCDLGGMADTGEPVRLTVTFNKPKGVGHIQDPTTGGVVNTVFRYVVTEDTDGDGCLLTCPLPANQSTDEGLALVPSGTNYSFQLTRGRDQIAHWPNFVLDNEVAASADTNVVDGVTCVPFTALLPPPATIPPTDVFTTAVRAAETITHLSWATGDLTYDHEGTGSDTVLKILSDQAGQALTLGTDGGIYLDTADLGGGGGGGAGDGIGHGSNLPGDASTYQFFELEGNMAIPDGLYRWSDATAVWVLV